MSSPPAQGSVGVTVIITAYNYGRYLADAIHSALAQTHPLVEVLVIDDGSTDNTPEVAASFGDRIRYHRQSNAGVSRTRNVGLSLATHEWVVFLDADDALYPWMVECAVQAALRETELPAVVMGEWVEWKEGLQTEIEPQFKPVSTVSPIDVGMLVLRNTLAPTALARKSILIELGGYDPEVGGAEDRDMWIRVAARHRFILLDQVFYRFRLVANSLSHQPERQGVVSKRVLAKARRNPDVSLPAWIWRESDAVQLYQSAMNYSMAGQHGRALKQALHSFFTWPWLGGDYRPALPALARLRFIIRHLQFLLLPRKKPIN